MECVNYTIEAEVPPEFSTASTCSTAFFKVASSLDQLDGKEAIRKHTLFTTNQGHLLEVEGGKVQRSARVPEDVTKIVVHHDFEPLQLYVVLLCRSKKAVLLAYHDFKVLQQWEGVKDIASADSKSTGTPQLILTELNDIAVVMSNAKLMSYACGSNKEEKEGEMEEEDTSGKKEAVQALIHMFKGGIKLAEQLRTERKMKENFITEELAVLRSRLEGQCDKREESLVPALTVGKSQDEQKKSVPSQSPNPLKVQQVYHKLVHDKWVVGVNVVNNGEQVLVSQLELILCCGEVPLCHSSQVLKTVKHSRVQGEIDVRITIDHLDPPILRPKKRATVVGVCEIPSFETGPSVFCSGLLSYTCKPLQTVSNQSLISNSEWQIQEYQVSVPLVELKASELHRHQASLEHCNSTQRACVTFSTVALVAASRCTKVSLTSLVSPLNTFITKISRHLKVAKVSGVSDFYVLHPGESHPLQHTGFTIYPVDSHSLELSLYSKDEKQALILAHTLLAALPEDASMQFFHGRKDASSSDLKPLNLHHMLLARMREATTLVMDGLEGQLNSNKAPRMDREEGSEDQEDGFAKYLKEREELLARKGDITFKEKEYCVWRKKLQNIQTEVDNLYLKFLKLNCASD